MLDEPTAGMNPTETAEMQEIIHDLKRSGLTILLIEHKLEMVMRLSDRIIVMDKAPVSPRACRRRSATTPRSSRPISAIARPAREAETPDA
jgi:ABC-type sugar transport system ATPase subunit